MHHRPQPYASYPPQPNAHQASTLCITGPSVNVHRVARNGRNFEYLSGEDPYLGSQLVPAYVQGVQGAGVMAVTKHFALNQQETHRDSASSVAVCRTGLEP
tara:strand:- start:498 stop:800 length:303 start_codon:yes stop_codon:yes gene_type:complete